MSRADFYEKKGWNGSSVLSEKRKGYYSHDILGSVVMVTESRGRVREEYGYDAYGNCYEGRFRLQSFENDWDEWFDDDYEDDDGWGDDSEGGFQRGNRYGYNGKRYDPVVGLYNYGYRDYKPVLGRWTTVDPIKDSNNWYVYVYNNPIKFIDPLGLFTLQIGYSITVGAGRGGTAGQGIIFGYSREKGLQIGSYELVGKGVIAGVGLAGTIDIIYSGNPDIEDISGPATTEGFSGGEGIFAGYEETYPETGAEYSSTLSIGVGVGTPLEWHRFEVETVVEVPATQETTNKAY